MLLVCLLGLPVCVRPLLAQFGALVVPDTAGDGAVVGVILQVAARLDEESGLLLVQVALVGLFALTVVGVGRPISDNMAGVVLVGAAVGDDGAGHPELVDCVLQLLVLLREGGDLLLVPEELLLVAGDELLLLGFVVGLDVL